MKKKLLSTIKVNLFLDILKKDSSGYHEIRTVFHEITTLYDEIFIKQRVLDKGDEVIFKGAEAHLIDTENNTIKKTLKVLKKIKPFNHSYKIEINKKIPIGAGLGGASSNAASIILALNEPEELNLQVEDAEKVAAKIGMDAPFFILGGTALGEHFGEIITHLKPLDLNNTWRDYKLLLVIPGTRKQTKRMYKRVRLELTNKDSDKSNKLIEAIEREDPAEVLKNMHNDFEIFTDSWLQEVKEKLKNHGALKSILCGSGTSVFSIFPKASFSKKSDFEELSQALPNLRILDLHQ